jgi:hypothetical protein
MSVTDPTEPVERPRPTGGVDWAKDDHAVAVVAPDGRQTLRFSITHDAAGEIERNSKPDGTYQPFWAHNQALSRRKRPRKTKLDRRPDAATGGL